MSAKTSYSSNRRLLMALGAACALIPAVLAGCAPQESMQALPPPPGSQYFPLTPSGLPASPNLSSMPEQVRSMMLGTYSGTLFTNYFGVRLTQGYTLSISQVNPNSGGQLGGIYIRMNLDSDGPSIGNIHLDGYMAMGLSGYGNLYSLMSEAKTDTTWSTTPLRVQIVSNVSHFPAQSTISILECGLNQGPGCGVLVDPSTGSLGFEPGTLVKR